MALSLNEIDAYRREAMLFYALWFFLYVTLGLGAIVLPGLAALGPTIDLPGGPQVLAGLGSLCAVVFGFLRPQEYATAFDRAIIDLRLLRAQFELLDEKKRVEALSAILRSTAFQYKGTLSTGLTDRTPG